jgi:hypothetical protein
MPFYRCHIDTPLPVEMAVERIRAITRDPPGFREFYRRAFRRAGSDGPPFLGKVHGHAFRLRRDITGMNTFLPLVWGSVRPGPSGSEVSITMFVHPLVAAFMLWLAGLFVGAWTTFGKAPGSGTPGSVAGGGMFFVIVLALALGCFIPEAIKARRLLEEALRPR